MTRGLAVVLRAAGEPLCITGTLCSPVLLSCMIEERRIAVLNIAGQAVTLLFLLFSFWVVVITAVDSALFYAVFPYRRFVAGTVLVLLALVPGRNWRLKLGVFLMLIFWFSVLPRVSWHEETNFFINAGTIHKGMTVAEARSKMRPFLSATSPAGDEVTFQPDPASGDRCVIKVRDGKVRDVQMLHE